jgi:predicted DNA-binding protein
MAKQKQVQIHIYISQEVKEKLEKLANKQGRTVSELVREGIAYVLQKWEKDFERDL